MTLVVASASAAASDVDSEHLFGFTEGADIGKKGEREAETETIGHFGKSAGSYAAMTQNDSVKVLPTSVEARYMLMNRHSGPFGLTIIAEPRWGRVDATSGESLTSYGGLLTVVADRELIDNCLFGALNTLYDAQTTRFPVAQNWANESKIGFSSALSARISPTLFLGGEVRYLRVYDGLGLDTISGQALFAGPTFYLQIAHGMALSGAWNMQIAGRAATGGSLDITHFERHQVKVRFNLNFWAECLPTTIADLKTAFCIVLADKPKTRAFSNKVDVQTLVSSPIFRRPTIALQIFEVYSPALFVRRVGSKIMLGARRPLADSYDVLLDVGRQGIYVIPVPRTILACPSAFGSRREFTAKQKANG
jgi:hypothetical protein